MDTPKHEKIVKQMILPDGTVEYIAESYYDKLEQRVTSHRKTVISSNDDLVRDTVATFVHLSRDGSPVLNLTIRPLKYGQYEIVKQWIVSKEK